MPSGSRKRNKGKDRRAKQLAKRTDNVFNMVYNSWSGFLCLQGCVHGCAIMAPDFSHPVATFMNHFFLQVISDTNNGYPQLQSHCETAIKEEEIRMRDAFEAHPQVFQNESYRKMLLNIFIRIGTNVLMAQRHSPQPDLVKKAENVYTAMSMTAFILVLEEYDKTNDFDSALVGRATSSKRRHLSTKISSNERDVLKFYRKRISCKCLKRMHLDSRKSIPKMGCCFNCNVENERASLSVCSRCMVTEYCSRECQVANWDKHMRDCEECIRADVCW